MKSCSLSLFPLPSNKEFEVFCTNWNQSTLEKVIADQ